MTVLVFILFAGALVVGVPVAFAMGLAGASWILFVDGLQASILARRMYGIMSSFPFVSIPLFCMIGILAERCGLLPELVKWLQMLLGRMRGGMAYINVAASMIMGGVSGTAVSDVAALGRIEMQLMTRAGYPLPYSAALTAATAVMAPIIPPSVAMVIYGLASGGVSIGGLFLAGIIPGILVGGGFFVMVWNHTRKGNFGHLVERPGFRMLATQTLRVLPFLLLPIIIVGGIVGGIFTVTESAAVGVVYTLLVGFIVVRTIRWKDVVDAILYSAVISGAVGMLLGAGGIVSWIMTRNQVTQHIADYLINFTHEPFLFMVVVAVVLLALGTVMEATALIIALAPLLVPIARQYGVDDLQFGLVFVVSCMVGMITPPVGILLFIVSSVGEVPLDKVFRAIVPFVAAPIIVIALLIAFPELTTWIPALFGFGDLSCARC